MAILKEFAEYTDIRFLIATSILLLCFYPLTIWTYNLFFHPLAGLPGPYIWAASRIPYMRAVWGARYPQTIQKLHEQYGDIVRIAPNEVSFIAPAAWDDIYSNRTGANSEAFRKSKLWHSNPEKGPPSVFFQTDLKAHARIRRFMDPAFSERSVLQQEPILQDYVDLLVEKIRERKAAQGHATVKIIEWLNFTLFDMVGSLSFGESFGCLEKCEYEPWMDNMAGTIKLNYLAINLRHYPILTTLLKPLSSFLLPNEIIAQYEDYLKRSAAKLDRRLKSTSIDRPDFFSKLLKSEDREKGLTPEEVMTNSRLFINAACETSVTALTGAINNLIQNPNSLSILEKEIRVFSETSDLTLEALRDLPYLNAVLKETLRMCNPTPMGNVRITPPQGGVVAGRFIAGDTLVVVSPMALSYSPKYFHSPTSWHPERWLPNAETNPKSPFYHDHRDAVRAFGWGPQNCVGQPLGWAWMRLILAKVIWSFDLRRADTPYSKIEWETQDVFAIVFKHRLDVVLAERSA